MTKGARSLGLWAPIPVEMNQNIGRGAEEQGKCASAEYGLYCWYSANINTFVIDSIMLILYQIRRSITLCSLVMSNSNIDLRQTLPQTLA